jgi:hypothetical protein
LTNPFRYPLCPRKVEDLLFERGVALGHERNG